MAIGLLVVVCGVRVPVATSCTEMEYRICPFWSGRGGGLQERDIEVESITEPLTR